MSDDADELHRRLVFAQDRSPTLDITLPNQAPISLQVPFAFWNDLCQHFYDESNQVNFTQAFLKAIFTKALSAAIKATPTEGFECDVVDGVPLTDEVLLNHVWATEADYSVASASGGDTDKNFTEVTGNLLAAMTTHQETLMTELASVKTQLEALRKAVTARPPKNQKKSRKELPLTAFTNLTGGLIAKLPDVVERLRQFGSKFAPPPGPFEYDLVQDSALSFPTVLNFAASLMSIPPAEHMPTANSDAITNCGKQGTSVLEDFKTLMTVASRLTIRGSTIRYKLETQGGSPKFLEYEQDVMFIFKLHLSTKDVEEPQAAYLGYFPICRTFVYASDWVKHPFTDGHESRYLNDADQKIPVHFWHISKDNVDDKNDLFRAISHRLFRTKVNETQTLTWASMAILDPKVKKDELNPPYDHGKTPLATPKRKNSTSATKTADSVSSDRSSGSVSSRTRTSTEYAMPLKRPRRENVDYSAKTKRKRPKK